MDREERAENRANAEEPRAARTKSSWKLYLVSVLLILATFIGLGYQRYGPSFGPDLMCLIIEHSPLTFLEASARSRVSRVKADLRSMATALESYAIDNNAYPTTSPLIDHASDPELQQRMGGGELNTVQPGRGLQLAGLTTPVAYLTSLYTDPFTSIKRRRFYAGGKFDQWVYDIQGTTTFAYYCNGEGWLLWSPGPDRDYDITDPTAVYHDDSLTSRSAALINLTYDPTNGIESSGDIYRFKQ